MKVGDKVRVKQDYCLTAPYTDIRYRIDDILGKTLIVHSINSANNSCEIEGQHFLGEATGTLYHYIFPIDIFESVQLTQQYIVEECDHIRDELLRKNRKYGDSAVNPVRIFSKADNLEQIRVRLDDKINRLINQQGDEDEDVLFDLIGYLVLYRVAKRIQEKN